MVSQYGGSAGVSWAADLLNAYNQRDYNLINTQMGPIMEAAGAMNPLVGQLQARAEYEQLKSNTTYNYANPLLNATGQIYSHPLQTGTTVNQLSNQTSNLLTPKATAIVVTTAAPPQETVEPTETSESTSSDSHQNPIREFVGGIFKNFGQKHSAEVHERNAKRKGKHHHKGHHHAHHPPGHGQCKGKK